MRDHLISSFEKIGGKTFAESVIADTVSIPHQGRGQEIKNWLEKNPVGRFVIFEDSETHHKSMEQVGLGNNLIKTLMKTPDEDYSKEGITQELAELAIKMLNS
jgi:hypothetical protein